MVLAAGTIRNQTGKRHRLSRRALLVVPLAAVATAAAGVWNPADLIHQIPEQYLPEQIQDRFDTGSTGSTMLPNAYLYQQQRSLSCEFASATIAANMGGWGIDEFAFDDLVPLNENPHFGFRGNIHGEWGNIVDYGVYNEPIHAALGQMGIPSTVIYAEGERDQLTRELDSGRAVVVWLAMRGAVNSFDTWARDGTRFQLTQYMHVMTAYGYDDSGVYLTDPGTAIWQQYPWDVFMEMWNVMDGMALSVHPTSEITKTETFSPFPRYL